MCGNDLDGRAAGDVGDLHARQQPAVQRRVGFEPRAAPPGEVGEGPRRVGALTDRDADGRAVLQTLEPVDLVLRDRLLEEVDAVRRSCGRARWRCRRRGTSTSPHRSAGRADVLAHQPHQVDVLVHGAAEADLDALEAEADALVEVVCATRATARTSSCRSRRAGSGRRRRGADGSGAPSVLPRMSHSAISMAPIVCDESPSHPR